MTWQAKTHASWTNTANNNSSYSNTLYGWNYCIASNMRKNGWLTLASASTWPKNYWPAITAIYTEQGTNQFVLPIQATDTAATGTPSFSAGIGWVRTPAGYKRDRGHKILSVSSNSLKTAANWFLALNLSYNSGNTINGTVMSQNILLAWTTNFGLFGTTGKDIWFEKQPAVNVAWDSQFDLSFLDASGLIPAPLKANKALRMYMLFCCFWFYQAGSQGQGTFLGNGPATADQGITINLRSGDINAVDVDAGPTDPILATVILGADMFSIPDTLGRFYLSATQAFNASASGTVGYAEILGCLWAAGQSPDGRTRLIMPVSTLPAANTMALSTLNTVNGASMSIYDLGFQFKIADV